MDLRTEILSILNEAREKIVSNIDSEGIRASGRTQKSLQVEDRGEHLVLVDKGEGAPFETLQYGREAGKVPYRFNYIIRQWIVDKPITVQPIPYKRQPSEKWQPKYTPQERGLMQAAGAIAHKIATKGTDRHLSPNENVYTKPINEAIDKIEKIIVTTVISKIRR